MLASPIMRMLQIHNRKLFFYINIYSSELSNVNKQFRKQDGPNMRHRLYDPASTHCSIALCETESQATKSRHTNLLRAV